MNVQRRKNYFIDRLDLGKEQEIVIDQTFKNVVLTHITGNYMKNINIPLFLAIQGYPGEGKTFQTLKICSESGVKICYISGSELSGNYEMLNIIKDISNIGFLMNLCDKAKNIEQYRTPIILIGNSFKEVYEPLKRDGRMDFFTWKASLSQKCEIAHNLFNELLPKKERVKIQSFVEKYKEQPHS